MVRKVFLHFGQSKSPISNWVFFPVLSALPANTHFFLGEATSVPHVLHFAMYSPPLICYSSSAITLFIISCTFLFALFEKCNLERSKTSKNDALSPMEIFRPQSNDKVYSNATISKAGVLVVTRIQRRVS